MSQFDHENDDYYIDDESCCYSNDYPSDHDGSDLAQACQAEMELDSEAVPKVYSQDDKAMSFAQYLDAIQAYNDAGGLTIDPPFEPQPEYSPPTNDNVPPETTQKRGEEIDLTADDDEVFETPRPKKVSRMVPIRLVNTENEPNPTVPSESKAKGTKEKKRTMRQHPEGHKRCHGFMFTIFDKPGDSTNLEKVKGVNWDYCVVGREFGDITNHEHGQGYGYFRSARYFKDIRAALYPINIRKAETVEHALNYCKKDRDIIYEVGTPPCTQKQKGDKERERWATALASAEAGRYEELDPQIRFLHMDKAERHRERFLAKTTPGRVLTKHLWIWGESGTGKSRHVWDTYDDPAGSLFVKPCNKWWPLYKNEKVVLLDDFDKRHDVLIHYLKIWADAYPFQAEVKGSFQKIRPELIIVTSNYHPRDIWTEPSDLEPIMRRFEIKEFKKLKAHDDT